MRSGGVPRAAVVAALSIVATLALLGASTVSAATKAKTRLAGVVANSTDPYWITMMCGGTKEAKRLGVSLKWYTTSTTSVQTMSQAFDAALLKKPQGLYLNPFQASQFSSKVKTLMKQGTPVVTSTPLQPATEYSDTPLATAGKNFTKRFLKVLSKGPGSIVALGGVTGIPVIVDEYKPMLDAAKAARSDITVLPTQYTNFDVTKSTQIVSSLLLAHPDLKMIIASTGPEGQGAAAAVKQAGKAGKVQIWAFDAVPAEVQALKDGVITVLAAKPAQAVGAEAIRTLAKLVKSANGKAIKPKHNLKPLPLTIITKANINSKAAKASFYRGTCSS